MLDRLVHVVCGTLAVDKKSMQLEVEEVVKARAHVPTPVEEKVVEDEWVCDDVPHKGISLHLRDGVEDLVEKPESLGCRSAMVQAEQHENTFHEEGPVEVRGDDDLLPVQFEEKDLGHVDGLEDAERVKLICLTEDDLDDHCE